MCPFKNWTFSVAGYNIEHVLEIHIIPLGIFVPSKNVQLPSRLDIFWKDKNTERNCVYLQKMFKKLAFYRKCPLLKGPKIPIVIEWNLLNLIRITSKNVHFGNVKKHESIWVNLLNNSEFHSIPNAICVPLKIGYDFL